MANIFTNLGNGARRWTLDTSDVIDLGQAVGGPFGGSFMIQVKVGGAAPGSFVIKQTVHGSGYTGSDLITCSYTTTASAGAITAAGTAVTAAGIYVVISDGLDTRLDYTANTDGMTVTVWGGGA